MGWLKKAYIALLVITISGCGDHDLKDIRAYPCNPGGMKTSGMVVFNQSIDNMLRLDLSAQLIQEFDSIGGKLANSQFGLYYSGVRHKFVGTVFFPVSPNDIIDGQLKFNTRSIGDNEAVMVMGKEGWVLQYGKMAVGGPGFVIRKENSPAIRIDSSKEEPLIFEVHPGGYRFIEGKGTIVTLDGQTVKFPR
jgi:hypothetical protein